MTVFDIGRWRVDVDVKATRAAYALVETGYAEGCGCPECQNFIASRELAYSENRRAFFDPSGVDWHKETEVFVQGRRAQPENEIRYVYEGYLHLAGRILADESVTSEAFAELAEEAGCFFTSHLSRVPRPFTGLAVVQIEFRAWLPWLIRIEPGEWLRQ